MDKLLANHEVEHIRKASVEKNIPLLYIVYEDAVVKQAFYNGSLIPPDDMEKNPDRAVWKPPDADD